MSNTKSSIKGTAAYFVYNSSHFTVSLSTLKLLSFLLDIAICVAYISVYDVEALCLNKLPQYILKVTSDLYLACYNFVVA